MMHMLNNLHRRIRHWLFERNNCPIIQHHAFLRLLADMALVCPELAGWESSLEPVVKISNLILAQYPGGRGFLHFVDFFEGSILGFRQEEVYKCRR
jgi:hypothetical protein